MQSSTIYLTQEGLEKLKKELHYLKSEKRREVSERIQEAKEYGDLSENAEYNEAKNEQAQVEARILELENLVRGCQVIREDRNSTKVKLGSKIKVKLNGQEKIFEIIGSQEADPLRGKISNESPMGQAFLGHEVNDEIEIEAPKGKIKCQILEIL